MIIPFIILCTVYFRTTLNGPFFLEGLKSRKQDNTVNIKKKDREGERRGIINVLISVGTLKVIGCRCYYGNCVPNDSCNIIDNAEFDIKGLVSRVGIRYFDDTGTIQVLECIIIWPT